MELTQERERDGVIWWRRRQLLATGFPEALAAQVAEHSLFDLHAVIELVEHGCPPELAVRILAPSGDGDDV